MSLKPFYQLDETYAEQFEKLLYDERYIEKLMRLQGDEQVELADYLSDTASRLIRTGRSPRKCLHILRKISGTQGILPSTYEISGTLSPLAGSPVAHGGFGEVQQGFLSTASKEDVCIKTLRVYSSDDQEKIKELFCKEVIVWKHLNHPNIVPFKGVTLDPPRLVSEWMPGGELREYLKKRNPRANHIALLLGVAEGLAYLHSRDIIHGDLKGPNIVVDALGNARLTDFGLASIVRDPSSVASTSDNSGYTPRWTAPEIFRGHSNANKRTDVFSFTMVTFETVPFPNLSSHAVPAAIMNGTRPNRPTHPNLTNSLWKLTQKCWKDTPEDRPEIAGAIKELKEIKIVSPPKKPPEEPPSAVQEPPLIIIPPKQPVQETPPRSDVGRREEATPYDLGTPIPGPTPPQQKVGAKNPPIAEEIVLSGAITDGPPFKEILNVGNNDPPGNGPEVCAENERERDSPPRREVKGRKELGHRRSRKEPIREKAKDAQEGAKSFVHTAQEEPPDPFGSTTAVHVRKLKAIPLSHPATQKPLSHHDDGKDVTPALGSGDLASVENSTSPATISPGVNLDSESIKSFTSQIVHQSNRSSLSAGQNGRRPVWGPNCETRPSRTQAGAKDHPQKTPRPTAQDYSRTTDGPAVPLQLPTALVEKRETYNEPPPKKGFFKRLCGCL